MLEGSRNSILFPPFGSLSDKMPPVFTFLRICLKQSVVVRVNGGGIHGGIECGSNRDHCVGNGARVFVSVVFCLRSLVAIVCLCCSVVYWMGMINY